MHMIFYYTLSTLNLCYAVQNNVFIHTTGHRRCVKMSFWLRRLADERVQSITPVSRKNATQINVNVTHEPAVHCLFCRYRILIIHLQLII